MYLTQLAIPFLITPIVTVSMTYFAQKLGLIGVGYLVDPSFTPFFKIYEKNTLLNEMK